MSFTLLRVQLAAPLALFLQHISHFYEGKKKILSASQPNSWVRYLQVTPDLLASINIYIKKTPQGLALSNLNGIAIFYSSF